MKKIPVLMYHALEDAQHPSGQDSLSERVYVLTREQFAEQMAYLQQNGFTPLLARQLQQADLPQKPVVISFDDGHVSNFHLALPILLKLQFVATFFITTGFIKQAHYLNPEQIRFLAKSGMEIGSHSVSHPFFDDLTAQQVRYELAHSKQELAKISGQNIVNFSAPGGRLHLQTCQLAQQQGYQGVFGSTFGLYQQPLLCNIPRIAIKRHTSMAQFKQLVAQNRWLLVKKRLLDVGLSHSKKLLGNDHYLKIRHFLLGQK